jgi:hypothetical protein
VVAELKARNLERSHSERRGKRSNGRRISGQRSAGWSEMRRVQGQWSEIQWGSGPEIWRAHGKVGRWGVQWAGVRDRRVQGKVRGSVVGDPTESGKMRGPVGRGQIDGCRGRWGVPWVVGQRSDGCRGRWRVQWAGVWDQWGRGRWGVQRAEVRAVFCYRIGKSWWLKKMGSSTMFEPPLTNVIYTWKKMLILMTPFFYQW